MIFSGWTVARAIPDELWRGLLTGQYKLYGGVIRYAEGTARAGQIIRHLIPVNPTTPLNLVPNIITTYQLHHLSGQMNVLHNMTQQVLQFVTGTAVLAGLNLAVSGIGFMVLNNKINRINKDLQKLMKEVREIREILEQTERAKLKSAFHDLLTIHEITDSTQRYALLFDARKKLAELNECYGERLEKVETLGNAIVYEEYFCLAALGQIRCAAEIGGDMLKITSTELTQKYELWQPAARRIA